MRSSPTPARPGVLVALALAACVSGDTPDGYYEAAREVRRNLKTPEGHMFGEIVHQRTRNEFERAARRCYVHAPDPRGVRLLYRLDADARPVETLVYPTSTYGLCMQEAMGGLEDFELPPPPRPDYWMSVPVRLYEYPPGTSDP